MGASLGLTMLVFCVEGGQSRGESNRGLVRGIFDGEHLAWVSGGIFLPQTEKEQDISRPQLVCTVESARLGFQHEAFFVAGNDKYVENRDMQRDCLYMEGGKKEGTAMSSNVIRSRI